MQASNPVGKYDLTLPLDPSILVLAESENKLKCALLSLVSKVALNALVSLDQEKMKLLEPDSNPKAISIGDYIDRQKAIKIIEDSIPDIEKASEEIIDLSEMYHYLLHTVPAPAEHQLKTLAAQAAKCEETCLDLENKLKADQKLHALMNANTGNSASEANLYKDSSDPQEPEGISDSIPNPYIKETYRRLFSRVRAMREIAAPVFNMIAACLVSAKISSSWR